MLNYTTEPARVHLFKRASEMCPKAHGFPHQVYTVIVINPKPNQSPGEGGQLAAFIDFISNSAVRSVAVVPQQSAPDSRAVAIVSLRSLNVNTQRVPLEVGQSKMRLFPFLPRNSQGHWLLESRALIMSTFWPDNTDGNVIQN